MAKKNAIVEEPATVVTELTPWAGYPSRDFVNPIDGVENARLVVEEPVVESTDGGQE